MKKTLVVSESFNGQRLTFLVLVIAVSIFPAWAPAHDGWVEVTPTIIEKGRLRPSPSFKAITPTNTKATASPASGTGKIPRSRWSILKGKQITLTDRIIDLGEDEEKIGPKGPKGFYLASYIPNDEGLYQAVARQARSLQQGDGPKLMTVRIAKTAFAAFKVPTISAAKNLKGFDRLVAGEDGVEFIPVNNPLAVFSGGSMTLELRQKGKPTGGQVVTLVRRIDGFASVQERTTDDKGRVTFAVGPADFYLARVKIDEESPRPDGQKDKNSYESTYVFQVFNRP